MPQPAMAAQTSVDVDSVWRQFMTDFATGDRYWWWPRSIRVDPNEIIADDDEGHLWRIPFSTDGETQVTFDDPAQVRETFVDVATSRGEVLATYTSAPERPAPAIQAASRPRTTQEVNTMSEIALPRDAALKVLRSQGRDVDDDATDEQIAALFNDEPAATGAADEDEKPDDTPARTPEPAVAATSKIDDDTVTVSKQVWDDQNARLDKLEADAQASATAAATKRRDEKADWAVRTGRIAPAERTYYRELLDIDETKTAAKLDGLTGGRLPGADEIGTSGQQDADQMTTTGWFPQLASKES